MTGYALCNGHRVPFVRVEMRNQRVLWTFAISTRGKTVWPTQDRIEVYGSDDSLIFVHPSGWEEVTTKDGVFSLTFDHQMDALEVRRPGVWVR